MDLKTLKDIPAWDWPDGTEKTIHAVLADRGAGESDRLLAAELAGDYAVINDDLADSLLDIVKEDKASDALRGQAAISLGPVLEEADVEGFDEPEDIPISEKAFIRIQESLQGLFRKPAVPKNVRRRILEASVRAPQDWHPDAVRRAYSDSDPDWRLTAVFCMRYIEGFEPQILESLDNPDPDIHYEAICAAGNWEVDAAWPHISRILASDDADKPLLLAAMDALVTIRPEEAQDVLGAFTGSEDEDIAEAAYEAISMAEAILEAEEGEEDEEEDD
jgi:hypothetical protein